jgi:hypothetical protein
MGNRKWEMGNGKWEMEMKVHTHMGVKSFSNPESSFSPSPYFLYPTSLIPKP